MSRIRSCKRLVLTRLLIINQAPAASSSAALNNSVSKKENLDVENLPSLKTTDVVKLEVVGVPPSVMSVSAPPSVEVYVRKGSLLTLQGNLRHITSSFQMLSPLKRLLYGNFAASYQKLIATGPISMLVTSNSPGLLAGWFLKSTTRSFASVSLDGKNDWAILKKDALHIFAGHSLNISMHPVPRRISRKLAKTLNFSTKEYTGLHKWSRLGFTFVSGRGVLGLVGNGLVYSANLLEGEEVSICKNNLLAVSVNGPYDLQNCVVKYNYPIEKVASQSRVILPVSIFHVKKWSDFVASCKHYYSKLSGFGTLFKSTSTNFLVGNQDFVTVIGPRTVLLQSGAPYESFERNFLLPKFPKKDMEFTKKSSSDYLHYVTFDSVKGAKIESTPDFKDSIKGVKKRF